MAANTVFRVSKNKENPYVMLNKKFLSNNMLSWKAKGILTYILSKPDDWIIQIRDLVNQSKDGEDSVYAGVKELRSNGYMQLIEYRIDGRIDKREYIVFEEQQENIPDKRIINYKTENETDSSIDIYTSEPNRDFPDQGKPDQEKPDRENPDLTNNDLLPNKDLLLSNENNNISPETSKSNKPQKAKSKTHIINGETKPIFDKINLVYKEQYNQDLTIPQFFMLYTIYKDPEIIIQAITRAKENKGNSIKYILTILKNWHNEKVTSVADLKAKDKAFQVPQHSNFTQRKYTNEELESLYENS